MDNQQLIDALRFELRTGFQSVTDKLGETNARIDQTNARIDQTNARLDQTNARLDDVSTRLDKLADRVDRGFDGLGRYLIELEKHHDARITGLEQRKRKD